MPKPLTVVRYAEGEGFSEITIDRTDAEWRGNLRRLIGSPTEIAVMTPFTSPFVMICDDMGAVRRRQRTALIVDLNAKSGVAYLFGPALFARRVGSGLGSVKPGDFERVQALPMWLRFDNLEARARVPSADEFTASGKEFQPQLHVILTGPPRQRAVFRNALWAKFECHTIAVHAGPMFGGADSIELMLDESAVASAHRFINEGLDDDGRFKGPWAAVE